MGCSSLYKIVIPGNIQLINNSIFTDSGLKYLIIEEGVNSIGNYTFMNCKNL